MRAIEGYEIGPADTSTILAPSGLNPLHIGEQNGRLFLWAEVAPEAPVTSYVLHVVGTGKAAPEGAMHLGSVVTGRFVWHIYMEKR